MSSFRQKYLYPILVSFYAMVALGGAAVVVGSALELDPLNLLPQFRPGEDPLIHLLIGFAALALTGALVYLAGLDPYRPKRQMGWAFLNVLPLGVYLGVAFILFFSSSRRDPFYLVGGGVIALVVPALALGFESLLAAATSALGRRFDESGSRGSAYFFLKMSLRWRPSNSAAVRRCALLLTETGRFKEAIPLLERLGSVHQSEDPEILSAMERAYRSQGDARKAVEVLRRLQKIRPNSKGLALRILDQLLALEMWTDAIEVLNSGEIAMDAEKSDLLFELYLKTGDSERALALAGQIEAEDKPPFSRSVRVVERLARRYPDRSDLGIRLGGLLLRAGSSAEMERGAETLEATLERDPGLIEPRRMLAEHYCKTLRPQMAEPHFKKLIEMGEADIETLLVYADSLKTSGKKQEAAQVYHEMRERLEPDWRAFSGEAELLFLFGKMDEADDLLKRAEELAPEESRLGIKVLRRRVIERRDEMRLEEIAEALNGLSDGEPSKRLNYVDQLLTMDRGDQAIGQCDLLIEAHPERIGEVIEALEHRHDSLNQSFRVRDYLADLYFRQARFGDALEMYRKNAEVAIHPDQALEEGCRRVLARAPDWTDAHRVLSEACMRLGKWAEAAEHFQWLTERGDEEDQKRGRRGRLDALNNLAEIEQVCPLGEDILARDEADLPAFMILIRAYQALDRRRDAHRVTMAGLEKFPDDDALQRLRSRTAEDARVERIEELRGIIERGEAGSREHYEKADLHREGGETQQAIIHYQRAAEDPELADVATTKLAICLCLRRLFDLADETLDEVALTKEKIERRPELRNMFYWIADTLEGENYHEAALKYFKRLFRVDAAFRDVVNRLERLDAS